MEITNIRLHLHRTDFYHFFHPLFIFAFRHSISLKVIGGESKSVTEDMTSSWNETTLPTILSNYKLEDIYNADEFGLFYQCIPNKTYELKGEKCSGGKNSKVRLTGMAAASASGEKLPMLVIGKSKKPRCFKNVRHLPCDYKSQKKSWMDSQIFEEWVRKLDRRFGVEKRKIALIIDNCPAHPTIKGLVNIQLIFLPPNTTSVLQRMDQGVIRSLKAHYRGKVVRKLCRSIEKKEPMPKISILEAMKILADSWNAVSMPTVVNCFTKAGITEQAQQAALDDTDDPFKELEDGLTRLRNANSSMVPEDLTPVSLACIDDDVITRAPEITEADIIETVRNGENEVNEESDDEIEEISEEIAGIVHEKPSRFDVEDALDILKDNAMYCDEGMEMKKVILLLEKLCENERIKSLKQVDIRNFMCSTSSNCIFPSFPSLPL